MSTNVVAGEVALWRAVIQQAVSDATFGVIQTSGKMSRRRPMAPNRARIAAMRDARAWLTGMSPDFRTVCDGALLDPLAVKAAAERTIASFDRRCRVEGPNAAAKQMSSAKLDELSALTL